MMGRGTVRNMEIFLTKINLKKLVRLLVLLKINGKPPFRKKNVGAVKVIILYTISFVTGNVKKSCFLYVLKNYLPNLFPKDCVQFTCNRLPKVQWTLEIVTS